MATTVTVKELAAQLKMDPKKARRILRKHPELGHDKGNRWEFTPKDVESIKTLLTTKAVKEEVKEPFEDEVAID